MRFPLPVASSQLRSRPASTARLLNCYAEQLPPGAKTAALVQRTHGVEDLGEAGNGPILALHSAMGAIFAVTGSKLYRFNENLGGGSSAVNLGDIGTPGNIDIDSNGSAVVVVNEPDAFYYDGTTFAQITDVDFTARGAADVEFVDNWLLFREPNSGRFFGADLGSASSFDALNFATAEGFPDDLMGLKVDHRQVGLFGSETIELWQNTGIAGFPFERAINGLIEIGCLEGRTIAKQDNSIYWVANDFTVRRLEGTTPIRVSTHAVEQAISTGTAAAMRGFAYSQDGHLFYVLWAPEFTWVFDATTKEWHERSTYGYDYWLAGCHAQLGGINYVGDASSNRIGKLRSDIYTDFGITQRVEWTYQPVYAEQRLAFHDRLEIVLETGVGLSFGQGSDPEMMLDYSDDGGVTWTSLPNRKIGPLGKYETRVVWTRLGSARQRVYRAAVSDPIPVTIMDTQVEVRGGRL